MSLRGRTVDQHATLPDGRHVTVHVNAGPGVFGNAPVTVITTDFGVKR